MSLLRRMVASVRGAPGGNAELPQPLAFPPPYRAMLAINSDVEWTNWEGQLVLLREFADRGLETAFSYWLFGSPKATWRVFEEDGSPSPHADAAIGLMRAGLLDTNHSVGGRRHQGGVGYDRAAIERAYEFLAGAGIRTPLYTNHGGRGDRQNVAGSWADYQEGDLPGSDLYHLDLTLASGARFFWCDPDYVSDPALLPEIDSRHGLFVSGQGRDGNSYLRFRRYLGQLPPGGPSLCNLETQLDQVLDADAAGYTVVYQHLGVERLADGKPGAASLPPLRADAARALDRLKGAQDAGRVLVTTTARLLQHAALMTAKPWRMQREGGHLAVMFGDKLALDAVQRVLSWEDLEGWTIPADGLDSATVQLNGEKRSLETFIADGRRYFGFRWNRCDMAEAIGCAVAASHTGNSLSMNAGLRPIRLAK